MIVIVEGIDRVGKTTFCERLQEETGWPVYKHDNKLFDYSEMDNSNETDKMVQLLDMIDQLDDQFDYDQEPGPGIIFDRFHLSNIAYGVVERDYCFRSSYDGMAMIEDRLINMKQSVILVMFYDNGGTYRASIEHGKDLYEHQCLLDMLYDCSKLPKIKGTLHDVDAMAEAVALASHNLEH